MAFKSLKILTTGSRGGFGNFIAKELKTCTFDRNSNLEIWIRHQIVPTY